MTTAPTVLASLLADCAARDVRLLPVGDGSLTIDAPQHVLTPDLVHRIKANKYGLLETLRNPTAGPAVASHATATVSPAASEQLSGNPPNCDTTAEHDLGPSGPDGWPVNCVDPAELTTCPQCDTLEPWQSVAGDWHCQNCDPPDKARQLRELALRLKTASQIDPNSTQRMPHGSEHLQHFPA